MLRAVLILMRFIDPRIFILMIHRPHQGPQENIGGVRCAISQI